MSAKVTIEEAQAHLAELIASLVPLHMGPLTNLPFHHRDPFDRLMIAQAMVEGIPIVGGDVALDAYPVVRLW